MKRQAAFRFLSLVALLASCFHVGAALGIFQDDSASAIRHWVFACLSACGVWYFFRRPVYLLPVYATLVLQQSISHGGHAIRQWQGAREFDFISIGLLGALYTGLLLVLIDARNRAHSAQVFAGAISK